MTRDDLSHALLDLFEVFVRDLLGQLEVIIEPVLDGRPDRVLRFGIEFQHGLRHDVRRRVADFIELRLFVLFLDLHFVCHSGFLS